MMMTYLEFSFLVSTNSFSTIAVFHYKSRIILVIINCREGPPGAPSGPLEATETSPDSITLMWNLPKDNGGLPIERFIMEKRLKNSNTWQKVSSSVGPKDRKMTVRNLSRGNEYDFRIVAVNEFGESDPLTTSEPIVADYRFSELQ